LKKGGRLVIVDQLPHGDESARSRFGSVWLGFSQEQLEGWLKKAGFSQIAWTPLSPEERRKASFAVAALA
jgi:ArsR family transcriptional regulator